MATTAERKQRGNSKAAASLARRIATLCKQFDRDVVRAALIECWRNTNCITTKQFERCAVARELRDASDLQDVRAAENLLSRVTDRLSLKDLESGFEVLIDNQHRRTQGAVYTPDYVVDYLVRHAVGFAASDGRVPVVCDPACGSGGFLVRAAVYLAGRFGITPLRALRQFVVGFDKDEVALQHARAVIELFLASRGGSIRPSELRLYCADTLLQPASSLRTTAHARDGFDVVVGNPPYVKLQNLSPSYRSELIGRFEPFIKGSFSLATLFLLAGQPLLARGGCLAYITQNNLFTSLAGEPVRRQLQDARAIRRIIDFGHARIFPGASAYTCLLFLGNQPRSEFEFASIPSPSEDSLENAGHSRISLDRLDARKWRLAEQPHMDHLRRIESTGMPLGRLARIRVGFATLRDAVFLVRERDGRCVASLNGAEYPIEHEFTRPAVRIADLGDQRDLAANRMRVVFPYEQISGRFRVLPEAAIASRFPQAYRYLSASRPLLDARDKGKPNPDGWYAWGRAQGRAAPGPKLLTKTFETRPNFMLDPSAQLFCNGYSVSLRRGAADDSARLAALQKLLNSSLMHYYTKLTSVQIEGGYQCYQKNFIERFGVPELTKATIHRLLNSSPVENDRWLAAQYRLPWADLKCIVTRHVSEAATSSESIRRLPVRGASK